MQIYRMVAAASLLVVLAFCLSENAEAGDCSELPSDVKTTCFDATDLSTPQAAFCRIWGESKWNNVLPHCLAVEIIRPNGAARIVYAWGKAPQWGINKSGYARAKAIIKEKTLKSKLPNGAYVEYRLSGDKLRGKFNREGYQNSIVLKRFGN